MYLSAFRFLFALGCITTTIYNVTFLVNINSEILIDCRTRSQNFAAQGAPPPPPCYATGYRTLHSPSHL